MTLVNILDNYTPHLLCIYSIVFKLNKTEMHINSIVRAWVMFFTFRRTHYNKNPLKWLSDYLYWNTQGHPLDGIFDRFLSILDEYPVENFHSRIRPRTNAYDDGVKV